MRELNFVAKTHKAAQEDKLDNARAKIEICQYKQQEAEEETKRLQEELNVEKRNYRVMEEELERQLERQLRKRETSRIVHQTYQHQIARLQKEVDE